MLLVLAACVDLDRDGWSLPADCDDANAAIHPGAAELCDRARADEDCDRKVNEEDAEALATFFVDGDGDGLGDPGTAHVAESCVPAAGMVDNGADCDDADPGVRLDAAEVCDGIDNDCDGRIDDTDDDLDPDGVVNWYLDADEDGYGIADTLVVACTAPEGFSASGTDCNDLDPAVRPNAQELCGNGRDDDCDGVMAACGLNGSLTDARYVWDGDDSQFGMDVCAPGDVDGDGFPDLLVGAPDHGSDEGAVWIFTGPLTSGRNSSREARRMTSTSGSMEGFSLAGGEDLNADGLMDMLIGVPQDGEAGARAGAVVLVSVPQSGEVPLDNAVTRLLGPNPSVQAGVAVAILDDVDGDQLPDVLVGATNGAFEIDGRGSAWLVSGPITGTMDLAWSGSWWDGEAPRADLGQALASAGDVDGDGLTDLLLGGPGVGTDGTRPGDVWLIPGPATAPLADVEVHLRGDTEGSKLGYSVSGGGDVNGDGLDDWIVGAPMANLGSGSASLFLGGDPVRTLADARATITARQPRTLIGWSVSIFGDSNGDGRSDVAVGAPRMEVERGTPSGGVAVFQSGLTGAVDARDGSGLYACEGDNHACGILVAPAGDMNLDGLDDLLALERLTDDGDTQLWLFAAVGR